MFTMKLCDLRPILVIFDLKLCRANLSVPDQIQSQFLFNINNYSPKTSI